MSHVDGSFSYETSDTSDTADEDFNDDSYFNEVLNHEAKENRTTRRQRK